MCPKASEKKRKKENLVNGKFSHGHILAQDCEFESHSWPGVPDTTLCGKICQWLATGQWLPPCTPLSSTKKTDRHDITYVLLKVALNTKTLITLLEVFQYLTI